MPRRECKHKHFDSPREIAAFINGRHLSKDDILYIGRAPDKTWEMLCYLDDDGYKQDI